MTGNRVSDRARLDFFKIHALVLRKKEEREREIAVRDERFRSDRHPDGRSLSDRHPK